MENNEEKYNTIIKNIKKFGKKSDKIRAVLIIGSRARTRVPADKWSDLDIILVTRDPEYFINSSKWLLHIGKYWFSFVEETAVGEGKERRVLFEKGLDVDFAVIPDQAAEELMESSPILSIFQKGYKIIIDKDDLFKKLPEKIEKNKNLNSQNFPAPGTFKNLVKDFWYHCIWSSKKFLRGELLTAKNCIDSYMKYKLIKIIKWKVQIETNQENKIWHEERFFERWAPPEIKNDLKNCYAHYDKEDVVKALFNTMDLFKRTARKISEELDFTYPEKAEEKAYLWVEEHLK